MILLFLIKIKEIGIRDKLQKLEIGDMLWRDHQGWELPEKMFAEMPEIDWKTSTGAKSQNRKSF